MKRIAGFGPRPFGALAAIAVAAAAPGFAVAGSCDSIKSELDGVKRQSASLADRERLLRSDVDTLRKAGANTPAASQGGAVATLIRSRETEIAQLQTQRRALDDKAAPLRTRLDECRQKETAAATDQIIKGLGGLVGAFTGGSGSAPPASPYSGAAGGGSYGGSSGGATLPSPYSGSGAAGAGSYGSGSYGGSTLSSPYSGGATGGSSSAGGYSGGSYSGSTPSPYSGAAAPSVGAYGGSAPTSTYPSGSAPAYPAPVPPRP